MFKTPNCVDLRMNPYFIHGIIFLLAMILLVKGSDIFVDSAARLARKLGISELIVGLTFVAIGTSIPELGSAIVASLQNAPELVIGNIIGSNIANICLIVGFTAVVHTIKANDLMVFRDGYIVLFMTIIFYLFMWGHILPAFTGLRIISWAEGVFFLILFVAYIIYVIEKKQPVFGRSHLREYLGYAAKMSFITTIKDHILHRRAPSEEEKKEKEQTRRLFKEALFKEIIFALLGLAALIIGAKYVVEEAIWGAAVFGIPQSIVGVTVVALGTSLPELAVAVSAARKNLGDIVIGNVIGSNITNILLVGGVASLITPLKVTWIVLLVYGPLMLFVTFLFLFIMRTRWKISRFEGLCLLLIYIVFISATAVPYFVDLPFLPI